ncbi:MAG: hypothetical protein VW625_10240, partial [Perlucidibaca sp.]
MMLAVALSVAPASAETLVITNQGSNDLSVLDPLDPGRNARVPIPGEPAGVAVSPELQAAFVVSPGSKTLTRLSLKDLEIRTSLQLDGGPIGVAVDPSRRRAFVSDWYNARIWVVDLTDPSALRVSGELVTGAAPAGLDVSADGRLLASADRDANQVSIFDADRLTLIRRIPVGERPFGLRFMADGRLATADVGSNTVTLLDPLSGATLGKVPTGERPYCVAFAGTRGFVTNQYGDSVTVFDTRTLEVIATLSVGEYPEGIDTSPDGRRVYV